MEKAYGIVKKTKGEYASVSIKRDSMCSDNCASCGLCSMKETVVTVKNSVNAQAGEKVVVTMESGGLLAAFLVYGMPVLLILFGLRRNSG
jgi:positive regulator of sigma E activity